ncbi:hypothetical protein [Mycolicibacterium sp. J2]|uniref:hypothetical protein n=1 Tax=Mycolicibacterium sp. J2 TaxID=2993511 RepID=UPI00224AD622|nr:hypothetical protein [Mycolicibacterium sp. J2]MCX2710457.1 hypothetical protein [Mycolicibacterium sp. J2]
MKSIFVIAALIGAAILGGFTVAAPAQASCAPGFTSIPCTIVDNVVQAPQQIADGLAVAPGNLAGQGCAQPNKPAKQDSTCGLVGAPQQLLAGTGCPPAEDGSRVDQCGLPAVPGQALAGAVQIVTAPQTIAGNLAAAPGQLAGGLAAAPGQFVRAIMNGGKDPLTP